jgi:hypothetical protein
MRNHRAVLVAVVVGIGVGSLVVGGTAWSLGASSGAAARTVSTTEDPPTSSRSKTITFDADAQLHALVDLPDPLPVLDDDAACIDLPVHAGTWPVFNGSTITVPGYNAQLCPEPNLGTWTVGWYGTSQNGESGDAYLSAQATFIIAPGGAPGPRMLAHLTSGKHRYQYIPESDADDDQYVLTDSYYGDLVSTTLGATANPTVASTTSAPTTGSGSGTGAAPAVPVGGSPGYTG